MTDILFGNNNKAVIRRIARRRIRSNRGGNLFVIFAIVLTTVLFTTFFSVFGGILDQERKNQEIVNGTAHASIKYLTEEQYAALKNSDLKKNISYTRIVGFAANPELAKIQTEIRYGEEDSARSFVSFPTTGRMPEKENEIAVSTLILDALGIPHQLNAPLRLCVNIDGAETEKDFVISGFWKGQPFAPAQQIWVSKAYADTVAPAAKRPFEETFQYSGMLCADIWFSNTWNILSRYAALCDSAGISLDHPGGVNPIYEFGFNGGAINWGIVLAVAALLGIILFTGYLIIYNLFYISVAQNIQFFGLLRTIGASGRQLRGIVRRQAMGLAVFALPFGLLIGSGVGRFLLPYALTQFTAIDTGVYRVHPALLTGAAAFALLTVYISSIRPCRFAAKISAIEAVHYSGSGGVKALSKRTRKATPFSMAMENLKRSRKKVVLVVMSLTLSLTLLNTTYTAISGFDLERYVAQYAIADFLVSDYTIQNYVYRQHNLSGVTEDFLAEMEQLPGLENAASIYAEDIRHTLPEDVQKRLVDLVQSGGTDWRTAGSSEQAVETGETGALVYGLNDQITDKIEISSGQWDAGKWESGDYIIVDDFFYHTDGNTPLYRTGDIIKLAAPDGRERSFTVMAIGRPNYNLDAHFSVDLGLSILLPEKIFRELYGDKQPLCTIFNIDDSNLEYAEDWIEKYTTEADANLAYISRRTYEKEFERDITTFAIAGGVLSVILALIGLLNFVNSVGTSIISRQRELAMMRAIGMGPKQMNLMLICESAAYIVLSFVLTASVGSAACYLICDNLVSNLWEFTFRFTLAPVLACLAPLGLIAAAVPLAFYHSVKRKSLVEQLRRAE